MRDKAATIAFYTTYLGFADISKADYPDYLVMSFQRSELHFFLHKSLLPTENYGQIYIKVDDIESLYREVIHRGGPIHPNGGLATKSWGMREFSMLDPNGNLLSFGKVVG